MRVREASIEDAPTIAKVTVDTWETAYRGIIDDNYLNNLPYEEREQGWRQFPFNNSFVYVAEVQTSGLCYKSTSRRYCKGAYCSMIFSAVLIPSTADDIIPPA
jgi:hypothetical protein